MQPKRYRRFSLKQSLFVMWFLWAATLASHASIAEESDQRAGIARHSDRPALFIAGDSTAAPSPKEAQQGWGTPFADYFDRSRVDVINAARGGRSSRTFITEGHWERLVTNIGTGDFVLIQFGHNDAGALNEEPPGSTRPLRARGTIPGIGEETQAIDNVITGRHEIVHSFGWYLRKMIADVRERGATPILLSLTLRNRWSDGRIECGTGDYRRWIAQVANSAGVQFIDLSRILADRYQTLGTEAVNGFFSLDDVHTNDSGAQLTAAVVVGALQGLDGKPFASVLSEKGRAVPVEREVSKTSVCERIDVPAK
jgi:lysophospholipase L1-like esterase